MTLKS